MRRINSLIFSWLLVPLGAPALAGELNNAANFTTSPPHSRWSIGAGAMVRSIDADFHVAKPDPQVWRKFFHNGSSGPGDVGLYSGGRKPVRYEDGSVGGDYGVIYDSDHLPTGDAVGLIHSAGQLSASGRIDSFQVPISDLAFHSSQTSTRYGSTGSLHGLDDSDEQAGVGPYVTISYELCSTATDSVFVVLGWSFVRTDHGIAGSLGMQSINAQTTRDRYTYRYDYDGAGGALAPGARFPFNANVLGEGFMVYDPATYASVGAGTGFISPSQSKQSTTSHGVAATLTPVATAHLRVNLNEVVLAAQYQRRLTDRLSLGLSAGPTLNVIDATLNSSVSWYQGGRSSPLATLSDHASSTGVKVGLMGQVSLLFHLNERWFLEAHGSFRWVDPVTLRGTLTSVRVNPSSWEGGFGVGIEL